MGGEQERGRVPELGASEESGKVLIPWWPGDRKSSCWSWCVTRTRAVPSRSSEKEEEGLEAMNKYSHLCFFFLI